ncbi:MAG: hypothetical protein AAB276_03720 [Pseudomonadota bacterium]
MTDYTYPSVYFAYFFFFLVASGALYFCIRSYKDGYFGEDSEEVKYRMLKDDENGDKYGRET